MILYHGTNTDFKEIDLTRCKPYKDFGPGFYTTTLFSQAEAMAVRTGRIYGGRPCVIAYETPDDILSVPDLKIKIFNKTSKAWAIFIINNRNRSFTNTSSEECNSDRKYDIVYGPVANDTLTTLIERYSRGYIDADILLREMEYAAPTDQYSFHSDKAIALLKKVNSKWII